MGREQIIGVRVTSCRERRRVRAYFQDGRVSEDARLFIMVFLVAGHAVIKLGRSEVKLGKGEAYILKPGTRYRMLPYGREAPSFFILHFAPVGPSGPLRTLQEMGLSARSHVSDFRSALHLFSALAGLFLHRHRKIKPHPAQEASILALRILLLLEARTHPLPVEGPDDRSAEVRIWEVIRHINEQYKGTPSLRELAEKAVLSPTYFKRVFRRVTGYSPHRYILERKIERAKDFILVHGESLTTTAIELGFHDYAHFYRVFRKIAGQTPKQFMAEAEGRTA